MKKNIGIKREFLIIALLLMGFSYLGRFFMPEPGGLSAGDLYMLGIAEMLCGVGGILGAAILLLGIVLAFQERSAQPVAVCPVCGTPARSSEHRYCRNCGAALTK